MSKGEETKNRILFVARDLFYEYGFHKTTARMISEKANTNLGLLNYYFKNKNEMGLIIYSSIRDRFDELIAEYFPDMDELTLFLFSSTLELYLCITNEKYGNFFHDLSVVNQKTDVLSRNISPMYSAAILQNMHRHRNIQCLQQ